MIKWVGVTYFKQMSIFILKLFLSLLIRYFLTIHCIIRYSRYNMTNHKFCLIIYNYSRGFSDIWICIVSFSSTIKYIIWTFFFSFRSIYFELLLLLVFVGLIEDIVVVASSVPIDDDVVGNDELVEYVERICRKYRINKWRERSPRGLMD